MRKSLLALAVLGSLSSGLTYAEEAAPAAKEEKPSYTLAYNVGLFSQYIFRGLTQTNGDPALQGGVDFTHDSGFYLGAWGSNISWLRDDYCTSCNTQSFYKSGGSLEMDFYGGYRSEIAKTGVTLDVGALTYYYPGTRNHELAKANTTEVYAGLGWKWLSGKYWSVVTPQAWGWGKAAGSGDDARGTSYTELNLTVPVGDLVSVDYLKGVSILAHAARQNFKGHLNQSADYTDYKLGISKTTDSGLTYGAYWTATTAKDIAMTYDDKNIGHNTGTVFVQKTF